MKRQYRLTLQNERMAKHMQWVKEELGDTFVDTRFPKTNVRQPEMTKWKPEYQARTRVIHPRASVF